MKGLSGLLASISLIMSVLAWLTGDVGRATYFVALAILLNVYLYRGKG